MCSGRRVLTDRRTSSHFAHTTRSITCFSTHFVFTLITMVFHGTTQFVRWLQQSHYTHLKLSCCGVLLSLCGDFSSGYCFWNATFIGLTKTQVVSSYSLERGLTYLCFQERPLTTQLPVTCDHFVRPELSLHATVAVFCLHWDVKARFQAFRLVL